jgi:hypothetical protein
MPFGPTSSTSANVAASATEVTIFAANSNAVEGRTVFNDSGVATLYLKKGTGVTTSSHFVQIPPGQLYEFPQPCYRGVVTGLWSSASGAARTTEDS